MLECLCRARFLEGRQQHDFDTVCLADDTSFKSDISKEDSRQTATASQESSKRTHSPDTGEVVTPGATKVQGSGFRLVGKGLRASEVWCQEGSALSTQNPPPCKLECVRFAPPFSRNPRAPCHGSGSSSTSSLGVWHHRASGRVQVFQARGSEAARSGLEGFRVGGCWYLRPPPTLPSLLFAGPSREVLIVSVFLTAIFDQRRFGVQSCSELGGGWQVGRPAFESGGYRRDPVTQCSRGAAGVNP